MIWQQEWYGEAVTRSSSPSQAQDVGNDELRPLGDGMTQFIDVWERMPRHSEDVSDFEWVACLASLINRGKDITGDEREELIESAIVHAEEVRAMLGQGWRQRLQSEEEPQRSVLRPQHEKELGTP